MKLFINRLIFIFTSFFILRKAVVENTKLRFLGIASNTSEHSALKDEGMYEMSMAKEFKEEAKSSKIFFDIGSNIGNYSVLYRKVSKGKCYSWEPIFFYRFIHKLNELINSFNFKNFTLDKKFIGIDNNQKTLNLKDFCFEKKITPDLIKIDVEGAESIIIPSLGEDLLKSKLTIFLEFHVPQIKEDFKQDPILFLDFLFNNFKSIRFNRNHWGKFKGIPVGNWKYATKEEITKIILEILKNNSEPRGFGMILKN